MPTPETPASSFLPALRGAAAGAVGVWALDRLDWFLWGRMPEADRERTRAARPFGQSPDQVLVTKATQATGTPLSSTAHYAASTAVHYSVGIGPAIAYSYLRERLPLPGPLRGGLFGLGLWLFQDEGLNTVTGLGGRPRAYPWQDHARGAAAHVLFGVVTDAALSLLERGGAAENGRDDPATLPPGPPLHA